MPLSPTHRFLGRWPLLLAAAALPLLLGLASTFHEADRAVQRDLDETAHAVLRHSVSVAELAWETVDDLQTLAGMPCPRIESQLQLLGSLAAYFRAIGVTEADVAYCSSTFGSQRATLPEIIGQDGGGVRNGRWSSSISGTLGVKNRPAIIFALTNQGGPGSYAIVDGQYMIDFMAAVGATQRYRISLQVGAGERIEAGEHIRSDHPIFSPSQLTVTSPDQPITVSVISPVPAAIAEWWQALSALLPLSIILSVMLTTAAFYWQKRRLSFRDAIRRGIANDEFSVHYQPVYDSRLRRCNGVEALLRWQRPDGSSVRPDVFIAAAEAEGAIVELTCHLFGLVSRDARGWQAPAGFHVGINVAAEHLQHPDFVAQVREQLLLPLQQLSLSVTLELTERSLISDGPEVMQALDTLRAEGVRLAIDDFGTGHCAMSYLQTFPLDYLKIDRGFVNAIESLERETPVLDAIISLSQKLALGTVAEGVETRLQFDYLLRHGVTFFQGYLYARPMPADQLSHWLRTHGPAPL